LAARSVAPRYVRLRCTALSPSTVSFAVLVIVWCSSLRPRQRRLLLQALQVVNDLPDVLVADHAVPGNHRVLRRDACLDGAEDGTFGRAMRPGVIDQARWRLGIALTLMTAFGIGAMAA